MKYFILPVLLLLGLGAQAQQAGPTMAAFSPTQHLVAPDARNIIFHAQVLNIEAAGQVTWSCSYPDRVDIRPYTIPSEPGHFYAAVDLLPSREQLAPLRITFQYTGTHGTVKQTGVLNPVEFKLPTFAAAPHNLLSRTIEDEQIRARFILNEETQGLLSATRLAMASGGKGREAIVGNIVGLTREADEVEVIVQPLPLTQVFASGAFGSDNQTPISFDGMTAGLREQILKQVAEKIGFDCESNPSIAVDLLGIEPSLKITPDYECTFDWWGLRTFRFVNRLDFTIKITGPKAELYVARLADFTCTIESEPIRIPVYTPNGVFDVMPTITLAAGLSLSARFGKTGASVKTFTYTYNNVGDYGFIYERDSAAGARIINQKIAETPKDKRLDLGEMGVTLPDLSEFYFEFTPWLAGTFGANVSMGFYDLLQVNLLEWSIKLKNEITAPVGCFLYHTYEDGYQNPSWSSTIESALALAPSIEAGPDSDWEDLFWEGLPVNIMTMPLMNVAQTGHPSLTAPTRTKMGKPFSVTVEVLDTVNLINQIAYLAQPVKLYARLANTTDPWEKIAESRIETSLFNPPNATFSAALANPGTYELFVVCGDLITNNFCGGQKSSKKSIIVLSEGKIKLEPASLTGYLQTETYQFRNLAVTGLPNSALQSYQFVENVPWLDMPIEMFNISANQTNPHYPMFDARGLAEGTYQTVVKVNRYQGGVLQETLEWPVKLVVKDPYYSVGSLSFSGHVGGWVEQTVTFINPSDYNATHRLKAPNDIIAVPGDVTVPPHSSQVLKISARIHEFGQETRVLANEFYDATVNLNLQGTWPEYVLVSTIGSASKIYEGPDGTTTWRFRSGAENPDTHGIGWRPVYLNNPDRGYPFDVLNSDENDYEAIWGYFRFWGFSDNIGEVKISHLCGCDEAPENLLANQAVENRGVQNMPGAKSWSFTVTMRPNKQLILDDAPTN